MTDGEKLKQILCHLIDNAVKFTDRVQIEVSSRAPNEDKKVEFVIRDTGVGIPGEPPPVVFDEFWQLDSSVTRTYAGVGGLGLYIAKKFTELLGGEPSSARTGKGATFVVALAVT
jgi:signal transduction histidine kinase